MTYQLLKALNTNIFRLLGLEGLEEAKKKILAEKLETVVADRILLKVLETLNEKDRAEFLKIIDTEKEDAQKASDFVHSKIPDIVALAEEEVAKLKFELSEKVASDVSEEIILAELERKNEPKTLLGNTSNKH